MKFIVKSDFFRTQDLADVEIVDAVPCVCVFDKARKTTKSPDKNCPHCGGTGKGASKEAPHALHLHMGAIINLGKSANEAELQTGNVDNKGTKSLIAQLRYAGRLGDASDFDVVSRVAGDVVTETRRLAREKAQSEKNNNSELGDKIIEAVAKRVEPDK